jgi:hypothetical protein
VSIIDSCHCDLVKSEFSLSSFTTRSFPCDQRPCSIDHCQLTFNNDNCWYISIKNFSAFENRAPFCDANLTCEWIEYKTEFKIACSPSSNFQSENSLGSDTTFKQRLKQLIEEKLFEKPQKIQNCALLSMY